MEAKEKAEQLIQKYIIANKKYMTSNALFSERLGARMCAAICAGEISDALPQDQIDLIAWWKEVKSEIVKMK